MGAGLREVLGHPFGAQMPQPPGPPPRRDSLRKFLGSQKGAARATGPTQPIAKRAHTGDKHGRVAGETSKGASKGH